MKKTFLAIRNTFLSSSNVSWGTFALTGALVALLLRLLAPTVFWYAFAPLFRTADALAAEAHMLFSGFGNAAALATRNEQLVNEKAALTSENQRLLQKEEDLMALLGSLAAPGGARGIPAGVVARPPESPYDTLVIANGSQEGVARGQEAYGAGGVPLGVVSAVSAHFSRVTLFSAPGMMTNGWVGHAHTALTILGEGGGAMSATAARSAGILAGDTVFIPGPGMLPVGTVARVDGDSSLPSVTLRIQLLLNPFSIAWVELRSTGTALLPLFPNATSTLP